MTERCHNVYATTTASSSFAYFCAGSDQGVPLTSKLRLSQVFVWLCGECSLCVPARNSQASGVEVPPGRFSQELGRGAAGACVNTRTWST